MKKGFSLIELLISLIIISLILSAFVPIITKKLKHKEVVLSSKSVTSDCTKFDPLNRCQICDSTSCSLCSTQFNLSEGQYVDPKESCDVKQCPKNCATCDKEKCLKCKKHFILENGKCKGGTCLVIGNICVQKFNAGDEAGLEIPDSIVTWKNTSTTFDAYDGGQYRKAICWRGDNTNGCNSESGGYSGCNRTVCTWDAAKKICEHHGLRLPTYNEMAYFNTYSKGKGEDGLQLCNNTAGFSNTRCGMSKRCPGAFLGNCYPHGIWSLWTYDSNNAHSCYLRGDDGIETWTCPDPYPWFSAFGVRCVKDL